MTYTPNADGIYEIPLVAFGNQLQNNFGLRVREHSAFGGNSGGHAPNSYHNYDEAIDITDHRPDVIDGVDWKTRTANLRNRLRGIGDELLGPGDANHDEHVHLAARGGVFKLTQDQYDYFFGGNSGGLRATFAGGFTPPASAEQPGSLTTPSSESTKTPDILRAEAHERADNYAKMTKSELDKAYDGMRDDPNRAATEGMAMHRAYFKKTK